MKRTLAFILLFALCLSLAGCSIAEREPREYYLVNDFKNKAVGILEDSGLAPSIEDRISKVKLKTYDSLDAAVTALKNHKVESLVLDASSTQILLNKDNTLNKIIEVYTDNHSVIASLTIGDTAEGEFRLVIDSALSRLKGDGSYYKLLDKYILNKAPMDESSHVELNQTTIGRELNIGVIADAYPFMYKNDAGEWTGFDIEVANAIARSYGATPVFKEYAKDQLIPAMEAGEIRIAFGRFTDEDGEAWEHPIHPAPYFDESVYIVANIEDVGINPFTGK